MTSDQSTTSSILDIRKGSTLDYNFTNWKVVGEYNYFWSKDTYSREFMLQDRNKTLYLEIEDEEKVMDVSISKKIPVHKIQQNFPNLYRQKKIPKVVNYHGQSYQFVAEHKGDWRDRGERGEWESFTVWNYTGKSKTDLLSVERWDSGEWEAYTREKISKDKITNITVPPKKSAIAKSAGWLGRNFLWVGILGFFGFQFLICNSPSNRSSSRGYYNSTQDSTYNSGSRSSGGGVYRTNRTSRSSSRYSRSSSRSRGGGGGK